MIRRSARRAVWPALLALALPALAEAQAPRLVNARLETRSARDGLDRVFRPLTAEAGPLWIGYAAPLVAGRHDMCCYDSSERWADAGCCSRCALESHRTSTSETTLQPADARRISLEGPIRFLVLARVEGRRVDRVRTFSIECELDARGLPFYWITDVAPADSLAVLEALVRSQSEQSSTENRVLGGALAAIALHGDPAADAVLDRFLTTASPESLRKKTTFWLGNARGHRGYETLRRILRDDPSDRVREAAVFGLHQSREPEAVAAIIEAARTDRSTKVRGQALFWLAQLAGKRAADAITEAIARDPETDVKRRAVFALSQLPPDEGVPLLIQVARTNRNPAVRKQAMFWLGQSKDVRAVAFFEEVLTVR